MDALAARPGPAHAQGKRIVFTEGCFDILYRGHVNLLSRVRALGDLLIVGVSSDARVARLKGPRRPINPLADRMAVLAALASVDYIVPFDEETPIDLIRTIRPDILIKGGDHARATLAEAPLVESLGGVVRILPVVTDGSTTQLVERINRGIDTLHV